MKKLNKYRINNREKIREYDRLYYLKRRNGKVKKRINKDINFIYEYYKQNNKLNNKSKIIKKSNKSNKINNNILDDYLINGEITIKF